MQKSSHWPSAEGRLRELRSILRRTTEHSKNERTRCIGFKMIKSHKCHQEQKKASHRYTWNISIYVNSETCKIKRCFKVHVDRGNLKENNGRTITKSNIWLLLKQGRKDTMRKRYTGVRLVIRNILFLRCSVSFWARWLLCYSLYLTCSRYFLSARNVS